MIGNELMAWLGSARSGMTSLLLIGATALVLAIAVTPLMRRVALQTGTVDKPAARRFMPARCRCWAARRSTWRLCSC